MKINNKGLLRVLQVLVISMFFTSCKKFLSEPPAKDSRIVVKNTAHLNAILDNFTSFYQEDNFTRPMSTDDYNIDIDLYNARRTGIGLSTIQYFTWDKDYIPMLNDRGWGPEWEKIFKANMVLNDVSNVTGSESEKSALRADAHFIRAYSYWILANTYCLPYTEANKNELGLPVKVSTSFEETVERQSLEETYQLIESDLAEALKTPVSLQATTGQPRHWRASKAGVNAFAARYYLNRNNYALAIQHADAALADYNVLVNYNTEMSYGFSENVSYTPAGGSPSQTTTLQYPLAYNTQTDPTLIISWKEFLYFRVLTNATQWYLPSQELLNLYDKTNDLRYQYHIVENYSYSAPRSFTNPAAPREGYLFFWQDRIPSGPTVAEVLLTKAEAQARSNDFNGAMTTVNILRVNRMKTGSLGINLTASTKDEALRKIIDERRREMPFSQRWFDLRRYNNNEDPNDDVVITRTFYPYNGSSILFNEPVRTYTLPKNSRRYAAPIPQSDITVTQGILQQNKY